MTQTPGNRQGAQTFVTQRRYADEDAMGRIFETAESILRGLIGDFAWVRQGLTAAPNGDESSLNLMNDALKPGLVGRHRVPVWIQSVDF